MTLNLKLVRHHDGKWTALPNESDDIAQVSVTEKKSAPIDPHQLLKALDSLLSPEGGIRSIEDVPRLASLMKKFSKKLVSRCVYCNVLQATKSDILSEYLDKGGWETINTWLQYAKTSSSDSFLLEMLKLCKRLPMTLTRLKENNTAKVIKSLTKHENIVVKDLSNELVNQWMSIIKEKKVSELIVDKKKKKEKVPKVETAKEEEKPVLKPVAENTKIAGKLKGLKRPSSEKEVKPVETYEDVKIDPAPLMPVSKKPRADRPKTAKIYQKKFRATGLEEETPLPKNISKKTTPVDKTVVAAAKNAMKATTPLDRILEKKIKPENLMTINEPTNPKGIKLIPAKPRPTHILHESASFIDALISQPVVPVKRRKKIPPKPPTPTQSPTITPPKLQFYKDTIDEKMTEENKEEEAASSETTEKTVDNDTNSENVDDPSCEENVAMDTTEQGGNTPPNDENTAEVSSPNNNNSDSPNNLEEESKDHFDPTQFPTQLRSILSHGRRRSKKKSVRWVPDNSIKEIFYFDMDDTERVNVSRGQNFYDLKSIEMKREREAMEMAKRQSGDRVEEFKKWWPVPILIDLPPPLIVPGFQSQEKLTEILRQQSTLQEIYFTREMIPESPHEPDLEIVALKEPKIIPLDEENVISSVIDYSNMKPIPALPDILSTLMKLNATQPLPQANQNPEPVQVPMDIQPALQPLPVIEPVKLPNVPILHKPPFEPVAENPHGNCNGMIVPTTPVYNSPPPEMHNPDMPGPGEWHGPPPDMPPNDQFFGGYPMNQNNLPPHNLPPHSGMRGHGNNFRPNFRGGPRGMGSRPRSRIICRHFSAGHCRFGMNCTFLHPGINGPLL